jgi:hypothetical protein
MGIRRIESLGRLVLGGYKARIVLSGLTAWLKAMPLHVFVPKAGGLTV